jgi:DNA polymerase-3 subunit epsilon
MPGHWSETPIHVIDFEGSRATGVLEYGVATVLNGSVIEGRTRICAAIGAIPEAETRVHGIAQADTAGLNPFSADQDLFMDLRSSGLLCAHNASFEKHLIKSVWPYPRTSPDFLKHGRNSADWGPWIDTLRLYEAVYPALKDYSLGALMKKFGLTEELDTISTNFCPASRRHFHCALYDALGSALLLTHLGDQNGFGDLTLDWLVVYSQKAEESAEQTELF